MLIREALCFDYLIDFGPLAGESIPQDDCALIVTACQEILVIAAPADTATTNKVSFHFTLSHILNICFVHHL